MPTPDGVASDLRVPFSAAVISCGLVAWAGRETRAAGNVRTWETDAVTVASTSSHVSSPRTRRDSNQVQPLASSKGKVCE
jgi:hypothetical protein